MHEFDKDGFLVFKGSLPTSRYLIPIRNHSLMNLLIIYYLLFIISDGTTEQQVLDKFFALAKTDEEDYRISVLNSMYEILKYGDCRKPQESFRYLFKRYL